jgi:hypothetical protein
LAVSGKMVRFRSLIVVVRGIASGGGAVHRPRAHTQFRQND